MLGAAERPRAAAATVQIAGLDSAWRRAQAQVGDWRTVNVRLAGPPQAPWTITVDRGHGGQPQKRTTLTVDRVSGEIVRQETFADLSPGRRLRSWLRFAHTGEVYGLIGQTIAGIVSAGGVVLVYTGGALAWRRFWAWRSRRSRASGSALHSRAA